MLERIGLRARTWAREVDPFTNVYGVSRSIFAIATALTLAFNSTGTLFRPSVGAPHPPMCSGITHVGLFCVAAPHLDAVRFLFLAILLLVASGYRPRITGILHAYAAFSFQANVTMLEGGDQVASILALFLVPVTLLDDRRWHWSRPTEHPVGEREDLRRLIARVFLLVIRIQVAGIYFHAAVGKFAVAEWTDGTILYYWLTGPTFGAPDWLQPFVRPLLLNGVCVATLTWSVLMVEWALSAGLLAAKKYWPILLVTGMALHLGILVLHGLVSFSLIMIGALILYLRPVEQAFRFPFRRPTLS